MRPSSDNDVYSSREIALAAGVLESDVLEAFGPGCEFVPYDEAVRIGRMLAAVRTHLSSGVRPRIPHARSVPVAVSTTLHAAIAALFFFATFNLSPRAAALKVDERPADPMRLVFVATAGPGGGGGGGGLLQKAAPPRAMREGRRAVSSPVPRRIDPTPIEPATKPPEPKPQPLNAEPLPVVVAPIVASPADARTRTGVLAQTRAETDSHGPGAGGGAGTGKGTGLGEGDGSGIGPGSGGGTGGGPYRPGSGIEPPRLLQEIKATYTEEARRQGVSGDVELEIVVRRDGSVGDVRIVRRLGAGLDDRAVQAVRQWRFAPARRLGVPVDVVVEVAVEFALR
jgi:TonB family protein